MSTFNDKLKQYHNHMDREYEKQLEQQQELEELKETVHYLMNKVVRDVVDQITLKQAYGMFGSMSFEDDLKEMLMELIKQHEEE